MDYEPLRSALKEGDFLKADDIHRKKLIEVAGADAQDRGWVYFSEVRRALLGPSGAKPGAMRRFVSRLASTLVDPACSAVQLQPWRCHLVFNDGIRARRLRRSQLRT